MNNKLLTRVEVAVLYLIFGLITFGIVLSRTDRYWFEFTYTAEDGFIEWMTVLPLLLSLTVALRRLVRVYSQRGWVFSAVLLGIAAFCLFAAGEELSWGQRLLKLSSSSFFQENNSQHEINIHNLIIGGQRINIFVFSRLLTLVAALYLLVLPVLYKRFTNLQLLVDKAGIPVARNYQILACVSIFAIIALCPSGKRAELLEFGGCCLFFLIVKYPLNKQIYSTYPKEQSV